VPTRFAAEYWREQAKAGTPVRASVIHTSSTSGLLGNPGQTNYGAAKAGIAAFSIICAQELAATACAPTASSRRPAPASPRRARACPRSWPPPATRAVRPVGPGQRVAGRGLPGRADCPLNGRTFFVQGGTIRVMERLADRRHVRAGGPLDHRRPPSARPPSTGSPEPPAPRAARGSGPGVRSPATCPTRWGGACRTWRSPAADEDGPPPPRSGTSPGGHRFRLGCRLDPRVK
jgi:hypothetical protein